MTSRHDIPVELLERRTHAYLDRTTDRLLKIILNYGGYHIDRKDAKSLAKLLRSGGIKFPKDMHQKICKRIVELYGMDIRLEGWQNGHPV